MAKKPNSLTVETLKHDKATRKNMKSLKCPVCGSGVLEKKIETETFEYKGKYMTIPNYVTYECSKCEESIVDNKALKESGRILKDFQHNFV